MVRWSWRSKVRLCSRTPRPNKNRSAVLRKGTLETCDGQPHGMAATHADVINADLRAFVKSQNG